MLTQGGGAIVNVASIMGLRGQSVKPAVGYHASKGAVVNMTRALACEWGDRGIRVNAVAPTFVRTRHDPLLDDAQAIAAIERNTPLGRLGTPEDVAAAIVFLASPAAAMVTGHTLPVDGGWLAR
jgi:NAD(P)-dependent dehydrogenase (short-subunit alcohol dehydrogenase family)